METVGSICNVHNVLALFFHKEKEHFPPIEISVYMVSYTVTSPLVNSRDPLSSIFKANRCPFIWSHYGGMQSHNSWQIHWQNP